MIKYQQRAIRASPIGGKIQYFEVKKRRRDKFSLDESIREKHMKVTDKIRSNNQKYTKECLDVYKNLRFAHIKRLSS